MVRLTNVRRDDFTCEYKSCLRTTRKLPCMFVLRCSCPSTLDATTAMTWLFRPISFLVVRNTGSFDGSSCKREAHVISLVYFNIMLLVKSGTRTISQCVPNSAEVLYETLACAPKSCVCSALMQNLSYKSLPQD